MINDIISQAIVQLYEQERFYAEILLQMDRFISERIPTAGVRIKNKIELFINPNFFESMSPEERVAILKHECEHILRDHIGRFKELAPGLSIHDDPNESDEDRAINQMKFRTLNIAADLAINGGVPNIPKDGFIPQAFNLPPGETMEWYQDEVKKNKEFEKYSKFDDHALWAESEGDKEILKEKVRQAMNKAANKARAAGKMTSDQELLVSRMNYKPKNWKEDLRKFAAKNIESNTDTSRKKRNRRYGIQQPGIVKSETLHLGVAIDTSGSVSDEALNQFMAEIAKIAEYARVTVVEADSEVKNTYEFDPKKQYAIKGRGGTAYQPAFDYFTKETEVDGVIYFGDMDSSDEPTKPKYPVLWAVIGNQEPPAAWGSRTTVEIKSR